PGETEGGPDNRHRGADQWLYVLSGTGVAVVNGERVELREGTLVLIERGDRHEVQNTGDAPLKTLNVYVPPAYTGQGEELPAGRALRTTEATSPALDRRGCRDEPSDDRAARRFHEMEKPDSRFIEIV